MLGAVFIIVLIVMVDFIKARPYLLLVAAILLLLMRFISPILLRRFMLFIEEIHSGLQRYITNLL